MPLLRPTRLLIYEKTYQLDDYLAGLIAFIIDRLLSPVCATGHGMRHHFSNFIASQ